MTTYDAEHLFSRAAAFKLVELLKESPMVVMEIMENGSLLSQEMLRIPEGRLVYAIANGEWGTFPLDVERLLGITWTPTMASDCRGVISMCSHCGRSEWPWLLQKCDEVAQECGSCYRQHGVFACKSCFALVSFQIHHRRVTAERLAEREQRNRERALRRQERLNRVPQYTVTVSISAP